MPQYKQYRYRTGTDKEPGTLSKSIKPFFSIHQFKRTGTGTVRTGIEVAGKRTFSNFSQNLRLEK